jgi:hypothetical protein
MKFYSRVLSMVGGTILLYYSISIATIYSQQKYSTYYSNDDSYTTALPGTSHGKMHANTISNEGHIRPPGKTTRSSKMLPADEEESVQKYAKEIYKTTKDITPIDSKPIILNEHLCQNDNPYLIIMVPSQPPHAKHRQAIRETYAQLSRDNINKVNGVEIPYLVRTVFLLGRGKNDFVDASVLRENSKYNDIVQFDFTDSYHNLTLKMLHGFKWVGQYCKHATYVLKSDEDVFVNVALLIQQLKRHTLTPKGVVFGYIYSNSKVWRHGKWAIDKSVYEKDWLPRYASGTAYVLSVNILPHIVKEAKERAYVQVEDAYITGIIASEKLGASLVMLVGGSHLIEKSMEPCKFVEKKRVTKTNLNVNQLYSFWNALLYFETECHK